MAEKVVAIENLTQLGVIKDTPTVGLAPNAFTDVRNVRLRDNAVFKMKGEIDLDTLSPTMPSGRTAGKVLFITHWANPNLIPNDSNNKNEGGYYVYVIESLLTSNLATKKGHRVFIQKITDPNSKKDITPAVLTEGFSLKSNGTIDENYKWQSTNFASGFCLILNNGINSPHYVIDTVGNTNHSNVPQLTELPGWDSYNSAPKVLERTIKLTYGDNQEVKNPRLFDLGQKIDFAVNTLFVTKQTPGSSVTEVVAVDAPEGAAAAGTISSGDISGGTGETTYVPRNVTFETDDAGDATTIPNPGIKQSAGSGNFDYVLYNNTNTNTTFINLTRGPTVGSSVTDNFKDDDVIRVFVVSRNPVTATCGVIRSFGNFLVAGNLKEVDKKSGNLIRRMKGVVRTSDVAVAGSLPQNWNPFAAGTNTADEFTLSSTSTIQDLVPLTNSLYIYTNNSIHRMALTQSPISPVSFTPLTYEYGAQTIGSIIEFSGRHLVVGSNDIYIFTGNPGNITSIADMRVRDDFYATLSSEYSNNLFILNNKANDEIWINFPTTSTVNGECNRAVIYNYTLNNWTIRDLNNIISGVIAPVRGGTESTNERNWATDIVNPNKLFPVLLQQNSSNNKLIAADIGYQFSGSNYTSYIERQSLSVTPEFYTEQFNSIALLTQGTGTLNVKTTGSNYPATQPDLTVANNITVNGSFPIIDSYKSDLRIQGRFISYRVDDSAGINTKWSITGMQITVQEGGPR